MNINEFNSLAKSNLVPEDFFLLKKLLEQFTSWNQKINLSAIKEPNEIWEKHLADSILGNKYLTKNTTKKVMDVGTGGGFPLLPLAVIHPDIKFVGLDSVNKKLKVINSIAQELGLENVETIHARAEELGKDKKFREKFDVIVSRAVAPWATLLELVLPFVKVGGEFIAYQGPAIIDDLKKYKNLETKLGGKIVKVKEEKIGKNSRIFVIVKKIKTTSSKFPRPIGQARKNPLS